MLLLGSLFGLFITTTQAQEIRLGAKAGVNLSNLIIKDADPKPDMFTSFHLGGVVEIPITETFSVQPEILYSAQGENIANQKPNLIWEVL
ncbi:MAG TPA: outer membrane beta-barrel protein [Flavobacteriaceae bacterium]|nr:outer membrane beta-barrel protein [Flavobacteriaceae bacterium]